MFPAPTRTPHLRLHLRQHPYLATQVGCLWPSHSSSPSPTGISSSGGDPPPLPFIPPPPHTYMHPYLHHPSRSATTAILSPSRMMKQRCSKSSAKFCWRKLSTHPSQTRGPSGSWSGGLGSASKSPPTATTLQRTTSTSCKAAPVVL